MSSPLKRFSRVRTAIFITLLGLVVLAFVLHLGILSYALRGVLVLGLVALGASYVWEFVAKFRKSE